MDKNHDDISNKESNENKITLHKLYEVENDNIDYYKNAIIIQLFESNELLCVTTEEEDKTGPYLIELFDLSNKNLILTKKLGDDTSYLVVLDNNDIAFFVYGGTYIEGDILTELKSSVQILNITNPEKKIINCECPQLEDHSLFCNLVPLKIKGKIGVGIVFDLEIFIFLKSNEGEKYVNLKKIDNFGTLIDFYIYKNFFVSYDYYGLNYYDIDKDFELKTHNNLKTEDINVETDFLFQNS